MSSKLDASKTYHQVQEWWSSGPSNTPGILQTLKSYIAIPNQSPGFDPDVLTNGHQDAAVDLLTSWAKAQKELIPNLIVEVLRDPGLTPIIFCEIPASGGVDDTVLMYGHMDKQPPMTSGWDEGLGPWTPVLKEGKLYGRGGADDGYAIFASLNSIALLEQHHIPHARIVILIEACEESGSKDLPHYLDILAPRIGTPSLVVCLDSGCGNYEQLWLTSSLRGILMVDLKIRLLKEGVHSGMASGIVPSTFRILRLLLDRIENPTTGQLPPVMYAEIPQADQQFARSVASTVGAVVVNKFPFLQGAGPLIQPTTSSYTQDQLAELILNATWRPTISYTGIEGIPAFPSAGNVLRPYTGMRLSIRLPPTVEPEPVMAFLKAELERDPPYGAHVELGYAGGQKGWAAPALAPWLHSSLEKASQTFYKKPFLLTGEGGSIPFMGMLGQKFPSTQFVITGVLGPGSNAHGPNEFLNVEMAQRLTCCVAAVVADHAGKGK